MEYYPGTFFFLKNLYWQEHSQLGLLVEIETRPLATPNFLMLRSHLSVNAVVF
jgi:hypothetical protein